MHVHATWHAQVAAQLNLCKSNCAQVRVHASPLFMQIELHASEHALACHSCSLVPPLRQTPNPQTWGTADLDAICMHLSIYTDSAIFFHFSLERFLDVPMVTDTEKQKSNWGYWYCYILKRFMVGSVYFGELPQKILFHLHYCLFISSGGACKFHLEFV